MNDREELHKIMKLLFCMKESLAVTNKSIETLTEYVQKKLNKY